MSAKQSPSTQAGEFVREEMEHIREGDTAPARQSKRSHWSVQGAASRSKVTASKTRQNNEQAPGKTRSDKGPRRAPQKAFSKTSRATNAPLTREPSLRIKAGVVETREAGGETTLCTFAFGRREEAARRGRPALRCYCDSRRAEVACPKRRKLQPPQ